MAKNIFGEELIECSTSPMTGYFRDGCCHTDESDYGTHTVCAIMTNEFLEFSVSKGNDLVTPRPEYSFPGLKEGDRWCICALRFKEAYDSGVAPKVILEATNEKTLLVLTMDSLIENAYRSINED